MKILTPQQIRQADAYTIEHEPVASIDLMERACKAFAGELAGQIEGRKVVWIFCGTGNNGGDGLGVARLLHERKHKVKVWVSGDREFGSPDLKVNLERLKGIVEVLDAEEVYHSSVPDNLLVVDAIFGSGLTRPVEGSFARLLSFLNQLGAKKVAIDIPSGLFCDRPQNGNIAFQADLTITFQVPKLAFLLPENYRYVGKWKVVDIGLSAEFLTKTDSPYTYQQVGDADLRLPARPTFTHKGQAGHTLLIAGSKGKVGASILAARACLRAGAGLLTVHTPACSVTALHCSVPEAMVSQDTHADFVSDILPEPAAYNSIAIGPGIGTQPTTVDAFAGLLKKVRQPMVIDADGLNILSEHPSLLAEVPPMSILTPHPGEFRRLVGHWADDYERLAKQIEFSKKHHIIIVLKGAFSSISSPDGNTFFNSTGNPGMATAGSGDVLTGITAGLLSQQFSPLKSARLAVLIHGISGDLAAQEKGEYGLIASDLVNFLPDAFKILQ